MKSDGKEDPNDVLGSYAFANSRRNPDECPRETNTDIEDSIEHGILYHLKVRGRQQLSRKERGIIMDLLAAGKYSDVLKSPPDGKRLYRGMSLSSGVLQHMLRLAGRIPDEGKKEDANYVYDPPEGVLYPGTPYENRVDRGISSWSGGRWVAEVYAAQNVKRTRRDLPAGEDVFEVILTALAGDNPNRFLLCPGGVYKLSGTENFSNEDESIALAPILCTTVEWKKSNE